MHCRFVRDNPWAVLGNFNAILNVEDTSSGSSSYSLSMREFRECVEDIGVVDVQGTGLHFTWNQRPQADSGILRKIDRIMCNGDFLGAYLVLWLYFSRIGFQTILLRCYLFP